MNRRPRTILWLLAIAGSFGTLIAVPSLRETAARTVIRGEEHVDYLAEAKRRSGDGDAWLAALAYNPLAPVSYEDLTQAYEQATKAFPGRAAPHLLYADTMMANARYYPPQALFRAEEALRQAGALEPENAAVEYLLAALAISIRDEEGMIAHLRAALDKGEWNLHQAEATDAAYRVLRRRSHPEAFEMATQYVPDSLFRMNAVAVRAGDLANRATERGDVDTAIMLRLANLHLAELLLRYGYDVIDGLTGVIIWRQASEMELSDEAAARAEAGASTKAERRRAVQLAGRVAMTTWLRAHGQEVVADKIESLAGPMDDTAAALLADHTRRVSVTDQEDISLHHLVECIHAAIGSLVFLLLFALVAVAARCRGGSAEPVKGAWWWWALAVSASLGAALLLGRIAFASAVESHAGHCANLNPWGRSLVLVGLPVLAIITLALVLAQRLRGDGAKSAGLGGSYAATMVGLLLPVTAVICLVSLGLALARAREMRSADQRNRAIVERGDMQYYGLQMK